MKHVLDTAGTCRGLKEAISTCLEQYSPKGLIILSGVENGFTPEMIDPILCDIPVPIIGGMFPGILYDQSLLLHGTLVLALTSSPRLQIVRGLQDEDMGFDDRLNEDLLGDNGKTMIVFVDGLAMNVDVLLGSLFCQYGMAVNYLGGGAGALQAESIPCLMTNEGLIRDAAILAVLETASGVGVSHGMESVSGPHVVSDVRGNRIGSIDWQPARERFQELIGEVDPTLLKEKGFPISDVFSLAINRIGGESVVRDPFKADPDGSLYVVSELSEGGFVDIVQATSDSMVHAAANALQLARASFPDDRQYQSQLCFDCFTRWQFLGDRFSEEIESLQDGDCQLFGALTLGGEIANCGLDFLDYYNRTCVVGVLE